MWETNTFSLFKSNQLYPYFPLPPFEAWQCLLLPHITQGVSDTSLVPLAFFSHERCLSDSTEVSLCLHSLSANQSHSALGSSLSVPPSPGLVQSSPRAKNTELLCPFSVFYLFTPIMRNQRWGWSDVTTSTHTHTHTQRHTQNTQTYTQTLHP